MIKNYFITAWRNLWRNRTYSAINIFGLSIGIAGSLLILLWVQNEISWDKFHNNHRNIYQVWLNEISEKGTTTYPAMPYPLAEELEKTIPEIKNAIATDWGQTHLVTNGEKRINAKGYFTDSRFLKIFSFPVTVGPGEFALTDPNSIVLTESFAKLLFKDADPIGKTIRLDNAYDLRITAIVKDPPDNSTFSFDYLVPSTSYAATQKWIEDSRNAWTDNFVQTFVELQPGAQVDLINMKIKNVIKKHDETSKSTLFLHPMNKWHLYSDFKEGKNTGGLIEYVRIFSIVAVIILLIACVNFMNLATARSMKRAREVGVRKAIGSDRKQLIFQFLTESLFTSFLSFLIAIGIISLTLPAFNILVEKHITLDFSEPLFWLFSVAFIIVVGLVSGSYPSLYLASFKPIKVLKGTVDTGRSGSIPRKVLVTLQFTFSILLISGTIVVFLQLTHVKNRPTGFEKDNLVFIQSNEELTKNFSLLKEDLLRSTNIDAVCRSSSPVTRVNNYTGSMQWPGKREDEKISIAIINVDFDYLKTIGGKLKEGRDFSRDYTTDSSAVLINEAAATAMGLRSPLTTKLTWNEKNYTIIGVIKNILMTSPYQPVEPAMIRLFPGKAGVVSIKIKSSENIKSSLSLIEDIYKKYCPSYPFEFRFADREFAKKFTSIELIGKLANIFSELAIVISCLGLFGLVAFAAEQRKKEIGIRKTLGASAAHIVRLLSGDFIKLVLIAFTIASPLAWWIMNNWLQGFSYRINISWWVFIVAGALVLLISLITISFQSIKAAIANPVKSLRTE